jgi:hypothetical protein
METAGADLVGERKESKPRTGTLSLTRKEESIVGKQSSRGEGERENGGTFLFFPLANWLL